jgi:2-polyprenyl-3-methyl-5-hydroxy-6-metoxy-1,4-benzoquinol methylase
MSILKKFLNHWHFGLIILYFCYLHWTIRYQSTEIKNQSETISSILQQMNRKTSDYNHKSSKNGEDKKSPPPKLSPLLQTGKSDTVNRGFYGGKLDPTHLGGFITRDNRTIAPNVWNMMLGPWAVKSFIDLGCGKGFSSRYFLDKGAKVLCVEGSRDALEQSLLPKENIIGHDMSLGAWWPEETYDVLWSTEFLEHLSRPFMPNYLPMMRKAALIMISQPGWGGWHHVEVHSPEWWRSRMEMQGKI